MSEIIVLHWKRDLPYWCYAVVIDGIYCAVDSLKPLPKYITAIAKVVKGTFEVE